MTDTVEDLRARLARHEEQAAAREAQLVRYAADLRDVFRAERERTAQLRRSYHATVRALANAVEARDAYTSQHAERVAAYGLAIANAAGMDIAASPEIEFGFLLHDVGKVGVPDSILFKAARLTHGEFELMCRHPLIGWEILRGIDFLGDAKLVVRHHHERYDGSGYPDGLAGAAIPMSARVFAVADALDALTTDRPYRAAVPFSVARAEIARKAGSQFDPEVVTAYGDLSDRALERIHERIR